MIQLLLLLAVFGFIVYLIITYIPMPVALRNAVVVIAVVAVIFYLLNVLGIGDIPIPRLHH